MSAPVDKQKCREILGQMDSYLDRNLPSASTREFEAHLARCAECAQELESRRSLRAQLGSAVRSVAPPADLEARVRAGLAGRRPPAPWRNELLAIAATVVLCSGVVVAYQFGHLRLTPASREAYIASVSNSVASLMRVGLGDHIHCAVFRKYPQNPPALEEMSSEIGPEFAGIIPIVREHAPGDLRLVMAHRCGYHNRWFVHLVLKNDSRLLSVILTRKAEGEALTAGELAPALTEAGISIYGSSVQRFQIASFESRDYMLYIISDSGARQNLEVMRAMAPALKAFLTKLEG